jgi:hypothetical protein
MLGLGAREWTAALAGASAVVTFALAGLGGLTLLLVQWPWQQVLSVGIPYTVLSYGAAIAIGWSMPAGPDNPIGQMVSTVALMMTCGLADFLTAQLVDPGSAAWIGSLAALGCVGIAIAFVREERRELVRWPSV